MGRRSRRKRVAVPTGVLVLVIVLLLGVAGYAVISAFKLRGADAATEAVSEEAEKETSAPETDETPALSDIPAVTEEIEAPSADYPAKLTGTGRAITAVNSRTEADSEAPVHRIIDQGEAVEITGYRDSFAEISIDGGRFYVLSKYLVPDEYEKEQTDQLGCDTEVCFDGIGWCGSGSDGRPVAYVKRHVTGFRIMLSNVPEGKTGSVEYRIFTEGAGWSEPFSDGAAAGSEDGDSRIEAVSVSLAGTVSDEYDVYTRVWTGGRWTGWVMNGGCAGDPSDGKSVDGLCVSVRKKGDGAPPFAIKDIDPEKPMVALTYDDGPGAESTSIILDALESVGGRATFFLIGNQIYGENNAVVMREVNMGCEVGNHTYNHDNLTHISGEEIIHTALKCGYLIQFTCGVRPLLLRAPGGNCKDETLAKLGQIGLPNIMWSVDPQDWKNKDAEYVYNNIMDIVKDGDIVLMHDIHMTTAEASKRLIPDLAARGFQLVTVSELAAYRGGMRAGGQYKSFYLK